MDMFNNPHKREQFMTPALFKMKYGVHITEKMNGKMEGFMSLSTSPIQNPFCQIRQGIEGSVCSKCYADAMCGRYSALAEVLKRNSEILTTTEIPVDEFPLINAHAFRLESFGDVANEIQVKNYFNFARRNRRTIFSAWTKNYSIYHDVIESGVKKPNNLILIISSPLINHEADLSLCPHADKVFTVYDKEYAKAFDIVINCGKRKCLSCMQCYSKAGSPTIINELLK